MSLCYVMSLREVTRHPAHSMLALTFLVLLIALLLLPPCICRCMLPQGITCQR
jgi:hypothetical protein